MNLFWPECQMGVDPLTRYTGGKCERGRQSIREDTKDCINLFTRQMDGWNPSLPSSPRSHLKRHPPSIRATSPPLRPLPLKLLYCAFHCRGWFVMIIALPYWSWKNAPGWSSVFFAFQNNCDFWGEFYHVYFGTSSGISVCKRYIFISRCRFPKNSQLWTIFLTEIKS